MLGMGHDDQPAVCDGVGEEEGNVGSVGSAKRGGRNRVQNTSLFIITKRAVGTSKSNNGIQE
jgi:hypothetical protein